MTVQVACPRCKWRRWEYRAGVPEGAVIQGELCALCVQETSSDPSSREQKL